MQIHDNVFSRAKIGLPVNTPETRTKKPISSRSAPALRHRSLGCTQSRRRPPNLGSSEHRITRLAMPERSTWPATLPP